MTLYYDVQRAIFSIDSRFFGLKVLLMPRKDLSTGENIFLKRIQQLEEQLFPGKFDAENSMRMQSSRYYWDYRPSHHAKTGLITQADIELLSQSGKRLLSIGAHPAYLEKILLELGVPSGNILVTDSEPGIAESAAPLETVVFDATDPWPEIGTFDLIIFPESLCIAVGEKVQKMQKPEPVPEKYATDALEAELLAGVLAEALQRLRSGGVIRANGPQSHPNVVRRAEEILSAKKYRYTLEYERYFLTLRKSG